MAEFRIVVIATPDKSDLYFANQLVTRLNVVGVIIENQIPAPSGEPVFLKALRLARQPRILLGKMQNKIRHVIRERYAIYNRPENRLDFGDDGIRLSPRDGCEIKFTTGVKDINSLENVNWLKKMNPDLIAVCGASILKREILSIPPHGVLNLHGGLSQQYRGLFTTDWAVYNEQPEYIGATVHYIAPGIDDGDIIYQGRPQIDLSDNPHTLYVKVVKLGINMMEQAIRDIESGKVRKSKLSKKGDLYLAKMFTAHIQNETWRKLKKGVIPDYLADKTKRDRKVTDMLVNNFELRDSTK
jgi:hypothetical protein